MTSNLPREGARRPRIRWKRLFACFLAPLGALLLGLWFLCASMPGTPWSGALPALTGDQRLLAVELRAMVDELCVGGERNLEHREALERAIALVKARLAASGRPVRVESFPSGDSEAHNLVLDLPGRTRDLIVVGAHYDTARGAPGANDNGSGVAALCALAQRFTARKTECSLRFVAFANEEPPRFRTDLMGSRVHAHRASERGETIVAMLALETLGCYSDVEGSQHYPIRLLSLAYPSRGDFVAFVGDLGSRALVRDCVRAFRDDARFPSEGAALPAWVPGVDWSDHASFAAHGVPAVMVTDTAVFRDPHYHRATDTPEKLDYERLARVVEGLEHVLARLAGDSAGR